MKKKRLILLLGCLMLCGVAVAGTYAWLSASTNEKVNVFSSSRKVSGELVETEFDKVVASGANKNYLPGDTFAKDPIIKNTSDQNIYTAIKITYHAGENEDSMKIHDFAKYAEIQGLNTNDWELIKTDDYSQLYMYKGELKEGISTSALFTGVKINGNIELENGALPSFNIKVEGYVTQASNMDVTEDVKPLLISLAGYNK